MAGYLNTFCIKILKKDDSSRNLGYDIFMVMRQPHENRGASVYTRIQPCVIRVGQVRKITKLRFVVCMMKLGHCGNRLDALIPRF
jgi:hypothetical protein